MKRSTTTFALLAFVFAQQEVLACGKERWPVKVGTDGDAAKVITTPRLASVKILGDIPAPPNPNRKKDSRYPLEFKTYTVNGTVTLVRAEEDGDYHVVIRDAGRTMIVEFPSPGCAEGSAFFQEIASARKAIESKMGGSLSHGRGIEPGWKVRVTGVGFFDVKHGQTGVAPNGAELHPVLKVEFK